MCQVTEAQAQGLSYSYTWMSVIPTSLGIEGVGEEREDGGGERATHIKTFSSMPELLRHGKAQGLEVRIPRPAQSFISYMQSLMTLSGLPQCFSSLSVKKKIGDWEWHGGE